MMLAGMLRHRLRVPLCLMLTAGCGVPRAPSPAPPARKAAAPPQGCAWPYEFTATEEQFLDDLEQRIVNYFWTEVFPETGIAVDHTENRVGKVAATGFGLAAICVGVERGWINPWEGYDRILQTLNSFWDDPDDPDDLFVEGQFGLFWHFVDGRTGQKLPVDCVALCDSADFIAGVVVAGEYFSGPQARGGEVARLARLICDNVQWDRFVARREDGKPDLLSFGWVPLHVSESYYETDGLLKFNMTGFADNSLLVYALALGSDTHPIPQATWDRYVDTYALDEYAGYECVAAGQLFCRQVPHAFLPFSRLRDRKIDYWLDTVNALLADRVFNMRVNGYPPQLWGLTDAFGQDSYTHAAPPGPAINDGTVGCTAFAGALPHVPDLSLEAMRYVRATFGERVYGRYGFTSAVNARTGFVSPLYVGIELGPMLLLIENARSGLIWDLFRRSRIMQNFVARAGFSGVVDDFELPPETPPYAEWSVAGGRSRKGGDHPQRGRKCLEIRPFSASLRLEARLPANQLLAYQFARYLSVWLRDLEPLGCTATVDGRPQPLPAAGTIAGDMGWQHHYYDFPPHTPTSAFCALTLETRVTGGRPAVDNITLEAHLDLAAPEPVRELVAVPAAAPGVVRLTWTATRDLGRDRVARYRVRADPVESRGTARTFEFDATAPAHQTEEFLCPLEPQVPYRFSVTPLDTHGHAGPASAPAYATPPAGATRQIAYDCENNGFDGVEHYEPAWRVAVVPVEDGRRALRVDFQKTHPWNCCFFRLDPEQVAAHRFLSVRVRGRVALLGKLWCSENLQQHMDTLRADSDEQWTVLRFDTRKASTINPARDRVLKLVLFPEPGTTGTSGSFLVDEVAYEN